MVNRRPQLEPIAPAASAEQAAAILAAVEHFERDTAPPAAVAADPPDRWQRAAMLEGTEREWQGDVPEAWINT
jgi:hypothetical protein